MFVSHLSVIGALNMLEMCCIYHMILNNSLAAALLMFSHR
jgi:hypothetical protein